MKAYAYIYTRTLHIDYNVFTMPSSRVLPSSVAEDFGKKISGILCIDERKELMAPQYVYVRNSNVVLWGIAILNNVLFGNSEYSKDHVARPIRSFIGIILTDLSSDMQLPMDMDFFVQLYQEQIFPLWTDHFLKLQEAEIKMPSNGNFIAPRSNIDINTDKDVIRVFNGSQFSEQVLAACLSYGGDVSVATNVHSIDRVALSRFNPFTNVVLSQEKETSTEDFSVKYRCPNCKREVPYSEIQEGYCNSCRPCIVIEEPIDVHIETEPQMYECKKCHNMFERLTENGYCEACAKKRKYHKYAWLVAIIVFVLLSLKECEAISHFIPKIDIPSWSYPKDKEVNAPHKKENPIKKGYKNGNNTINKKINQK